MLDVRFSRRWYATLFAALASLLAVIALLNLHHLVILEIALVTGSAAAILSTTALGGWLSTVAREEDENKLSAWFNFAYIAAMGLSMGVGGELVRNLPLWLAAGLVGAVVFLPATIFLLIPAPGPDRRLAGESFAQFSREILLLLRRREVLITLLLFLTPCGSFALTNMLGRSRQPFQRLTQDGKPGWRSGGNRSWHGGVPALSFARQTDAATPSLPG